MKKNISLRGPLMLSALGAGLLGFSPVVGSKVLESRLDEVFPVTSAEVRNVAEIEANHYGIFDASCKKEGDFGYDCEGLASPKTFVRLALDYFGSDRTEAKPLGIFEERNLEDRSFYGSD